MPFWVFLFLLFICLCQLATLVIVLMTIFEIGMD